jgi:hypothetical protein
MGEIMKVILTEPKCAGGEARVKDLLDSAEGKLDLTNYEKATLERSPHGCVGVLLMYGEPGGSRSSLLARGFTV